MSAPDDATRRLAAVRSVLGERHTPSKFDPSCCSICTDPDACEVEHAEWPCLHERVRRAVEDK